MLQLVQPQSCKGKVWSTSWRKDPARASIISQHRLHTAHAAAGPTTTNHRQASIRRGAGAASAEAVQRPAGLHQSLVVDLLLAASAHACSLHHHGHVPQPLRLMPAGMALTREPLAAVQRDAQGDCQCKSWWPPWYLAGIPVVVVEYTSRIARRLSQCLRGAEIELVPVHLYERGLSLVNNTHLVS